MARLTIATDTMVGRARSNLPTDTNMSASRIVPKKTQSPPFHDKRICLSSLVTIGSILPSGGWPTFTPPRTRLPHPSRFSKGEHLRPRHHVHASHTNTRVPCYLSACPTDSTATTELDSCTLSPPVVTTGSPCLAPGRIAICFCRYSNRSGVAIISWSLDTWSCPSIYTSYWENLRAPIHRW